MLQFERCRGGDPQFQGAVAAQRLRPGRGGDIGADDGRPIRLQPGENAAAMARDDRSGEPRARRRRPRAIRGRRSSLVRATLVLAVPRG